MNTIAWAGMPKSSKIITWIFTALMVVFAVALLAVFPPMAAVNFPLFGEEDFFDGFYEALPMFTFVGSVLLMMASLECVMPKKTTKKLRFTKRHVTYFLPFTEEDFYWYTIKNWFECYFYMVICHLAGIVVTLIINGEIPKDAAYGFALIVPAIAGIFSGITLIILQRINNPKATKIFFWAVYFFAAIVYFAYLFYCMIFIDDSFMLPGVSNASLAGICSGWILLVYAAVPVLIWLLAWCFKGRKPRAWLNMEA